MNYPKSTPKRPPCISIKSEISPKRKIFSRSRNCGRIEYTERKIRICGGSKDWETLATGFIEEWEEENSGVDMFHFDSDEDVFCVYSQYIDDITLFAKLLREVCNDEQKMHAYLERGFRKLSEPE